MLGWLIAAVVVVVVVVVVAAVLYALTRKEEPPPPPPTGQESGAGGDGGEKAVGCVKEPCPPAPPPVEYELVELVEVVTQDKEKWVKGAAMDTADTTVITESVERKDKDGSNFKQYVNLDRDMEGQDKRHPEYGREISLRARVRQKDGKTDKLAGVTVSFSHKRTDGPNRSNPGGTDPDVWKGSGLTDDQKEGFGSKNGSATTSAQTDAKGWTGHVNFFLSAYGGDQFEIKAELAPGTPGATGAQPVKTKANYVVWRKFWYQMTYADGYNPPQPTKAEEAYAEVFAEMVKANEKKFKEEDFPDDLKERTFLKEYMLKDGGANKIVANVGDGSNIDEFKTNDKLKMTTEKEYPVKVNMIVCEYQCDVAGPSTLEVYPLKSNGQEITLTDGSGGPIVSKPALKKGAKLVVVGEWSTTESPWNKEGNITDVNIDINPSRASTLTVKVDLSKGTTGAPTPSVSNPVYVRLQVETAESFLGWAADAGIVAVYRPTVAAGKQGSEEDFNDTAAHEFGHKWSQTPEPTEQPDSLEDHPLQYVGHGGSGSHCRKGATVAAGPVNWQNQNEKTPVPREGHCIMYHVYSSKCKHKFCKTCKPYLQLQDMSSL